MITRLLTLVNSLCDLIYYPAECIAWLCEANVFGSNRSSRPFRLVSLICWLTNILVSIIGNTLKLIQYRRSLKSKRTKDDKSLIMPLSDVYKCILTLINNFCFLINCVHWLTIPGFLWSGKISVFMVGFCGTLATLCNIIKMSI
ncbi:hypothetical protein I4U23_008776 [Adineta vaga]|nr:hypothetical protein I4U23_008776 [Adineta vaga]